MIENDDSILSSQLYSCKLSCIDFILSISSYSTL